MPKRRLIDLIVDCRICEDRDRAGRLIMAGEILVNGQPLFQPSTLIDQNVQITVRSTPRYVSRAGQKLEYALRTWAIAVSGRVAADVGAATGGFTERLLLHGALRVYTIEIGKGVLDWKLRCDPRVVVLEETNILYLQSLPEPAHLVVIDTAWTPLRKALPQARRLLCEGGEVIALLKPNYEIQDPSALIGGVLRDEQQRGHVVQEFTAWAMENEWKVRHATPSPITGEKGNIEWLLHLVLP